MMAGAHYESGAHDVLLPRIVEAYRLGVALDGTLQIPLRKTKF
jgi:hypothetical protein